VGFLSWEEDFVLDITIRYWERARKAGLLDFDGWSEDFGAFYRAVEPAGPQPNPLGKTLFGPCQKSQLGNLRDSVKSKSRGRPLNDGAVPNEVVAARGTSRIDRPLTPTRIVRSM
jgi:hypothetical protein